MSDTRRPPPDTRSMRERMLAGDLYIADDLQIAAQQQRAAMLMHRFNTGDPSDAEAQLAALRALLGSLGEGAYVRAPLWIDYGSQIHIGARTFINYNAMLLDVAPIIIGEDVMMGPNIQLLTPTHPLDAEMRRAKWEAAKPITVGNNVWLGGGVIVCPGVTIGDNTVVGTGAVVTKNLPANVLAVGNPARIIRELSNGEQAVLRSGERP